MQSFIINRAGPCFVHPSTADSSYWKLKHVRSVLPISNLDDFEVVGNDRESVATQLPVSSFIT